MKKIFIGLFIVAIVAIGFISSIFFYQKFSPRVISPAVTVQPTQAVVDELIDWVDQANFKFSYPKSLKFDPHPEDNDNYAHIELTEKTHPGKLIIWVKDTEASDVENFIRKNKITTAIDSSLGTVEAKKYYTEGQEPRMYISTIKDGYLYQIEVDQGDTDYWKTVQKTVVSTFAFIEPTAGSQKTVIEETGSQEEGDFFEEETIE